MMKVSSLSTSIEILESEIINLKKQSGLEAKPIINNDPYQEYASAQTDQTTKILEVSKIIKDEPGDDILDQISIWFKENLILKIGVLMILAGFGWFVSYAFAHNWIGPVGRITLGVLVGSLITIFGTFRLDKNKVQGISFTILGSALVVMSVLAGQYYYNFFSPMVVLLIVFFVSIYVSISAVARSFENLAVYGLLISLLAPFLSHTSQIDLVIMYMYLFVISATSIWISVAKNWPEIVPIGITGILLYSLPIFLGDRIDITTTKYVILFLSYLISILYLVVNNFSLIKNELKLGSSDVYLTIANTAIILGFTTMLVPTIYQSLVISAWMLVYAFSGFLVFTKTKNEKMFFVHSLISILLLAIATSIELNGNTLVIAFAIEAAIISVASFVVTEKIRIAGYFTLLMVVPGLMSMQSLTSSKWSSGIMHSDFAVLALIASILAILGIFFSINKDNEKSVFKVHHLLYILSTFYIYSIIWLSSHFLFINSDMAVFISLAIFTIVGLLTHFIGLFNHHVVLKNYGMALLILVVIRLVFVDVWKMELALRIVTFIVLGVMFISTAFISKSQDKVLTPIN